MFNTIKIRKVSKLSLAFLFAAGLAACTVHPEGESDERLAADHAGPAYTQPFVDRQLLPLAADSTPDQLVTYAELSNAALEQHYWEWRSAIEQIPQDGTQKTGLMLSFTSLITNGTSALENNSLTLGNDPMNNLVLPAKLRSSATIALQNARAAGRRFDKARLELRNKILSAYADYALTAELIRLEQAEIALLELTVRTTESRVSTGNAAQTDQLRAINELEMAKNSLAADNSKLPTQLSALNSLLNRPMDAPLIAPNSLPLPIPLALDTSQILAAAAQNNPELQAQSQEIVAKSSAIERAKQEYMPDFGVSGGTDLAGMTQSITGSIVLPYLRYEALNAGIDQAKANLRAAEAMRRQAAHDLAGQVVADLATLHDAQRQADFYAQNVLPRAARMVTATQNAYTTSQATLLDLLDAQRSLIAIHRMVAEMRTEAAKRLADLEALTGQVLTASTQPASRLAVPTQPANSQP